MAVRLNCGLCGAMAVNGMLTRISWGHVELNPHGTAHACPVCLEKYPNDWQAKLEPTGATGTDGSGVGRRDPYGRNWSFDSG